ncbi:hypothetical protein DFH06DRAFT_1206016 [Mycena polygramma]|nr:hypothetical protein DFH06DRAFT_1206016 [Mycena polygramma]
MHPSLRLENLSALPFTIRRVAFAAAGGSRPEWLKTMAYIRADPGISSHKFLPVVFAALDPKRAPKPEMLASSDIFPLIAAKDAIRSIYLIQSLSIPVLTALWSRVWLWVGLLEQYQPEAIVEILGYLLPFTQAALKYVVHSTAGTHAFITRVWPLLPSQLQINTSSIAVFYELIGSCDESCGHFVHEFIDECGGDPSILATLVVRTLNKVTTACQHPEAPRIPRSRLHSLFSFLRVMETLDLIRPLLSAGIVRAHTRAIATLHAFPDAEITLLNSFLQLHALLLFRPGYPHLPEALKAGLLGNILAYGADYAPRPESEAFAAKVLRDVLTPSLVYYRVVSAVATAYPKISSTPYNPRFVASPIYPAWQDFTALVRDRLRLLEDFHSLEPGEKKGCSNLMCDVVQRASDFQRCAGCRNSCYCSRECQIADWKGDHREARKITRQASLGAF